MTKKSKYLKILKAVKEHEYVIAVFKDKNYNVRRRKILSDGKCYTSHREYFSGRYHRFESSCFLTTYEKPYSLEKTIEAMMVHDHKWITPTEIRIGKKRVKL